MNARRVMIALKASPAAVAKSYDKSGAFKGRGTVQTIRLHRFAHSEPSASSSTSWRIWDGMKGFSTQGRPLALRKRSVSAFSRSPVAKIMRSTSCGFSVFRFS